MPAEKYNKIDNQLLKKFPLGASGQIKMAVPISKDIWKLSNILTVNRKVFDDPVLEVFSEIHDCCSIAKGCNWDCTKVRYYHNGEYYEPHTDKSMQFLAFSYFHKEPKVFSGGELIFPKYNYSFDCPNNSLIMMPGWVQHGVSEVSIEDSDYFEGHGRYSITSFFGNKHPWQKSQKTLDSALSRLMGTSWAQNTIEFIGRGVL